MTYTCKAVPPVAGMGKRFLPVTKSKMKEMLPLIGRPLIQCAADHARDAGIEELIFVTAVGKGAQEDYFDTAEALEQRVRADRKTDASDAFERTRMAEKAMSFRRQSKPLGLGHDVRPTECWFEDETFAALPPDEVTRAFHGALRQTVAAYRGTRSHVIAIMNVPRGKASSYGILDISRGNGR